MYLQFIEYYLEEIGENQVALMLQGHLSVNAKFVKDLMLDQITIVASKQKEKANQLLDKEMYQFEEVLQVLKVQKLYKAEAFLLLKLDNKIDAVKALLTYLSTRFSRTKMLQKSFYMLPSVPAFLACDCNKFVQDFDETLDQILKLALGDTDRTLEHFKEIVVQIDSLIYKIL